MEEVARKAFAPDRKRMRAIVAGWLALAAVLAFLVPPAPVLAKSWESDENNVILEIPDGGKAWEWLSFQSPWAKQGIVRGAQRTVKTLKNGKPAQGQGALMHLAVRDAKEGMTVADLAQNQDVRDFLLKRFRGTEGDVEAEEVTMGADGEFEHPAVALRTKGTSLNLQRKDAPCEGILLATLARGKLIMMRLYAWPTEYDDEGLSVDINYLEGNALQLITAKDKKSKAAPKKAPPKEDEDDGKEEEEREDEVLEFRALGWRMVKDKKLEMQEIDEEERDFFLVFKASGSDRMGSYSMYIYAPPNSQFQDGQQLPPPDLMKWIGPSWWQNFDNNHPKGELATWKWPKKPETKGARTFLTVPYLDDEKNRKVVFKADKKRPAEASFGDMKKMGFVEKPRRNNIGKRGKGTEAVRGCMEGKRPTGGFGGPEVMLRFAWRSPSHSYRVFVVFAGEAYKKWGPAVRKTLESIEFGIKFKD